MKLQLRVALLVLVGAAAVLASTESVNKADAAQFGGRNGVRGQMPGGGSWLDSPGRMWQGRKMLGVQCGWRCMMPQSTGRTWQVNNGRLWQRSGGTSFRYLLSVSEKQQQQQQVPASGKESAEQWRSSMPSSFGRGWQGGSTGRIWQG